MFVKDDIEFVTEFPCLLGHPVDNFWSLVRAVFIQQLNGINFSFKSSNVNRKVMNTMYLILFLYLS